MASYPQYSVGQPNMQALSPSVATAINIVAQQLGVSPAHVAGIISSETAGSFMPDVTHTEPDGTIFTGAIQYSPENLAIAAASLGMTPAALTQSIVGQIMAIPQYAIDAGFKPGKMNAKQLYSAILSGGPHHAWNTPLYGGRPETINSLVAAAEGGGRLAKYADAVDVNQGALINSIIGGRAPELSPKDQVNSLYGAGAGRNSDLDPSRRALSPVPIPRPRPERPASNRRSQIERPDWSIKGDARFASGSVAGNATASSGAAPTSVPSSPETMPFRDWVMQTRHLSPEERDRMITRMIEETRARLAREGKLPKRPDWGHG